MAPETTTISILRGSGSPPKHNNVGSNNQGFHSRPPRNTPKKKSEKTSSFPVSNNSENGRKKGDPIRQPQLSVFPSSNNSDLETISTPSSVLLVNPLVNVSLTRDLSDLSGSYLNGTTSAGPGGNNKVPGSVYQSDQSQTSYQRPWRHAKVLSSSRLPQHPQPPVNDEMSVGAAINRSKITGGTTIAVSESKACDHIVSIEVVQSTVQNAAHLPLSYLTIDSVTIENHRRMPLLLLLMDPARKIYELMQMWIDTEADTVRSIVHTMQQRLGDSWRQDYDGVFQVRNNHFSQLIHVLLAAKYDVQPYELWVAKPWSMSAKASVSYAGGLLNHLKRIGVLSYTKASEQSTLKQFILGTANQQPANSSDDTILTLSKEAQQRIYIPGGTLKHHHACQFLSFSPPFETTGTVRVDVLSGDIGTDTDCESSLPSQLSDSHCGYSLTGETEDNILFLKANENDNMVPATPKSPRRGIPPVLPRSNSESPEKSLFKHQLAKTRSNTSNAETNTTASHSPMLMGNRKKLDLSHLKSYEPSQEVALQPGDRRFRSRTASRSQGLARWLEILSCKCDKSDAIEYGLSENEEDDDDDSYKPPNMSSLQIVGLDNASGTLLESNSSAYTHQNGEIIQYKIWDPEDAAHSTDGYSIVSESAPLLLARTRP